MTFAMHSAPAAQPHARNDDGRPAPVILVAPGERTCTICGETTSEHYCYRCSDAKETAGRGRWNPTVPDTLVPTISYLRPEEYRHP